MDFKRIYGYVALLRKGFLNKMVLKEKIVQIYEVFFQVLVNF